MHISETTQVMEALSADEANLKPHDGWSLISVVVPPPNGQLPLATFLHSREIENSSNHLKPD